MPNGPFSASRLKVQRAAQHISDLEAAFDAHMQTDWCNVELVDRPNPQPGQPAQELKVAFKSAPEVVSTQIGDAVHNLRAALDLLAVRLVELNNGNADEVMFPFARDAAGFPAMMTRRHLDQATTADQALIVALQPYHGGNADLRALHDLDIQDKHRALIPVANLVTTPEIRVVTDATGRPVGFDDGAMRVELVPGTRPQMQFVFPADSAFPDKNIVQTLRDLVVLVEGILATFEAVVRP